jgi:hypothetical protein
LSGRLPSDVSHTFRRFECVFLNRQYLGMRPLASYSHRRPWNKACSSFRHAWQGLYYVLIDAETQRLAKGAFWHYPIDTYQTARANLMKSDTMTDLRLDLSVRTPIVTTRDNFRVEPTKPPLLYKATHHVSIPRLLYQIPTNVPKS